MCFSYFYCPPSAAAPEWPSNKLQPHRHAIGTAGASPVCRDPDRVFVTSFLRTAGGFGEQPMTLESSASTDHTDGTFATPRARSHGSPHNTGPWRIRIASPTAP